MEINRNVKVKLELDFIDASVLMEAVNTQLDKLMEDVSIESIAKYVVLREIAKGICDQVIPVDQQKELVQKHKQDEIILQSLKKEKGE